MHVRSRSMYSDDREHEYECTDTYLYMYAGTSRLAISILSLCRSRLEQWSLHTCSEIALSGIILQLIVIYQAQIAISEIPVEKIRCWVPCAKIRKLGKTSRRPELHITGPKPEVKLDTNKYFIRESTLPSEDAI
jgi:hypothetical protein